MVVRAVAAFRLTRDPPCHAVTKLPNKVVEHGLDVTIPQINMCLGKAEDIHGMDTDSALRNTILNPKAKEPVTEPSLPLNNDI